MTSPKESLLGKETSYPKQYAPEILFPIARLLGRQQISSHLKQLERLRVGKDYWHVYELSWLDANFKPQVGIGRITFDASSSCLIESKSLKLYFNSLNFKAFDNVAQLIVTVEEDLTKVSGATVQFEVFDPNIFEQNSVSGHCIDNVPLDAELTKKIIENKHPDASLLKEVNTDASDLNKTELDESVSETLYSHLLRSNCPVTGQPDWGTVFVSYSGEKIEHERLLMYILSYRSHEGFHEQCVEQIFYDLLCYFKLQTLCVYASYTRRGGLDIHPCRATEPALIMQPIRLARC